MRLDRLLAKWSGQGKRPARRWLEEGRVEVDGLIERDPLRRIGPFTKVWCAGREVQARVPRYVMLHKPAGVVSATLDPEHPTVIDLIDRPWAGELHLAGRLDRFTTGLLILTNDSRFSEALTRPEKKVGKRYLVGVDAGIGTEVIAGFAKGLWFAKEKVHSAPAQLCDLSAERRTCRLTIYEGKHHQVKRMFARYGLKVISLHREAMGGLELDANLAPGAWREFSPPEGAGRLSSR
ncbi:MAG: pseudouridine synthase [Verrucomicrobiales bacterium]